MAYHLFQSFLDVVGSQPLYAKCLKNLAPFIISNNLYQFQAIFVEKVPDWEDTGMGSFHRCVS